VFRACFVLLLRRPKNKYTLIHISWEPNTMTTDLHKGNVPSESPHAAAQRGVDPVQRHAHAADKAHCFGLFLCWWWLCVRGWGYGRWMDGSIRGSSPSLRVCTRTDIPAASSSYHRATASRSSPPKGR
jgi:hypothetical protein